MRALSVSIGASLGLLTTLTATSADAFVRTRTRAGVAIAWPSRCLPFHVNNRGSDNVGYRSLGATLIKSFAAWEQVDCSDLELTYQGDTNIELVGYKPGVQNVNMVVFQEDEWPHAAKIIALTTVTYCTEPSGEPCDAAGKILDADIEMNGVDFIFTVSPIAALSQYDIQNTVTHEVGHFIGLDHTPVANATMYETAPAGERSKSSLEQDDQDGLCEIYPHLTPVPACEPFEVQGSHIVEDPYLGETGETASDDDDVGCCQSMGASRTPPAALLFGLSLLTAVRLRRRRLRS